MAKKQFKVDSKKPLATQRKSNGAAGARLAYAASFNGARIAAAYQVSTADPVRGDTTPGIQELLDELETVCKQTADGDLRLAESVLIAQAHALQAIFTHFATCARDQTGLPQLQAMMGIALKAQSQCKTTLQALVEVKYPRQLQFVRQQNVAVNQQINNKAQDASRAREIESEQNKLLEAEHGQWLDTGAKSAASAADTQLETVGELDRTKDSRG